MRSNLLALQKLTADIGRAQTRLATGRKVNSPTDNPAAFFTASALNARAAALNSVIDGIGNAKQTLEAASAGIEGMQALIDSARSLAYQALNSTSTLAEVDGSVTGLTGATSITALGFDNGDTITVSDGTVTATYTHAAGQDVQDFLDAVNNHATLKVEASLTSDGRVHLEATGVNDITIGGSRPPPASSPPSGSPPAPPPAGPMRRGSRWRSSSIRCAASSTRSRSTPATTARTCSAAAP